MDGNKRPTIEEIKNHPWFLNKMSEEKYEQTRSILLNCHNQGEDAKEWLKKYMSQNC